MIQRDAFLGGFREMEEEIGLTLASLKQVDAYSKVDSDSRGRTITIAYLTPLTVVTQDETSPTTRLRPGRNNG